MLSQEQLMKIINPYIGGEKNVSRQLQKENEWYITVKDEGMVDLETLHQIEDFCAVELARGRLKITVKDSKNLEGNKMGKYNSLAKDIIKNVGGKENIISIAHCVTRLRFQLKDESKANDDVLKKMDGVVTVMKAGGQYQVVIGNHVPDVYKDVCEVSGFQTNAVAEPEKKKMNAYEKLIDIITGVFNPSISVLCASGIIKGVLALLTMFGVLAPTDGMYLLLNAAGDAMFYFFPVVLGYNASKKFGGNPFLGMILGGALVYPSINGIDLNVFGMNVNASYANTVLPIIILCAIAVPFEKFLNKIVPDVVKTFVTPAIILMICVPLGFCVIGPAANMVAALIVAFFDAVYNFSPILVSILLGGLWQVLVLFGVHSILVITLMMNLIAGVPQPMMAAMMCVSFVQTGAVCAIWLKTKDQKLKAIALPAWISGIFGVTEPAIYGVTLPRMKQFVLTCIGGAIQGAISAIIGANIYTRAGMGLFGITGFIDPANPGPSLTKGIILMVAATVIGFVLSFITFKDDDDVKEIEKKEKKSDTDKVEIASPLSGKVIPLTEVKDEAFSGELLGKGVAVDPADGNVVAPCNGTITTVFPTKHAIGMTSENGAEILIHLGLDTVKLDGEYFTAHIAQGDAVKKGQLLVTVDLNAVKKAGYSMVSPIIITNTPDYQDIVTMCDVTVKKEEALLTLMK